MGKRFNFCPEFSSRNKPRPRSNTKSQGVLPAFLAYTEKPLLVMESHGCSFVACLVMAIVLLRHFITCFSKAKLQNTLSLMLSFYHLTCFKNSLLCKSGVSLVPPETPIMEAIRCAFLSKIDFN